MVLLNGLRSFDDTDAELAEMRAKPCACEVIADLWITKDELLEASSYMDVAAPLGEMGVIYMLAGREGLYTIESDGAIMTTHCGRDPSYKGGNEPTLWLLH